MSLKVLTIKELKQNILKNVQNVFLENEFKFNAKDFSFKKESATAKIEFIFRFYSYYPSHDEYSFFCTIYLKELEAIINEYLKFLNTDEKITWNVLIVEGEYISELLKAPRKSKDFYTNEVGTFESVQIASKQSLAIIERNIFPLLKKIDHLSGFKQNCLLPQVIMDRINERSFVISCLLSAYLINIGFFEEICQFIVGELKKSETIEVNHNTKYILIENLRAFVKHKMAIERNRTSSTSIPR